MKPGADGNYKICMYFIITCSMERHAFLSTAINVKKNSFNLICIKYIHSLATLLASTGLDPFCLHNCLNSLWQRFNKVLETFLRDFGPH